MNCLYYFLIIDVLDRVVDFYGCLWGYKFVLIVDKWFLYGDKVYFLCYVGVGI